MNNFRNLKSDDYIVIDAPDDDEFMEEDNPNSKNTKMEGNASNVDSDNNENHDTSKSEINFESLGGTDFFMKEVCALQKVTNKNHKYKSRVHVLRVKVLKAVNKCERAVLQLEGQENLNKIREEYGTTEDAEELRQWNDYETEDTSNRRILTF